MSTTQASIGYGHVLEIALASAPTVFTYIKELTSAEPPADADDTVEATHMQSPNRRREYVPGLSDGGEATFEMNYVAGSASDIFLRSIRGKALKVRQTFPNGIQLLYDAARSGYTQSLPNEDKQTATLTLKVSGDPALTEVTTPRNLVLPVITGTPKVGVALAVNTGDWAGAETITFQWQADTAGNGTFANIVGATGSTYVPVAGDQGDDIRCVVTGANASLSASANTVETASVAAA